jgi:hypothetical protein
MMLDPAVAFSKLKELVDSRVLSLLVPLWSMNILGVASLISLELM